MLGLVLPWFGGLVVFLFIGYAMYETVKDRPEQRISVHKNAPKNWHRKALLTLFSDLKENASVVVQTR